MLSGTNLVFVLAATVAIFAPTANSYVRGGFTINENQFTLNWEVNYNSITFRAIGNQTGFVGFGISPKGTMEMADMFMGGVLENGTADGMDCHGSGMKDEMQNYHLHFAMGGPMYTEIHASRMLITGDCKDDIPILNEPQYILWAMGPAMDKIEQQGSVLVNLLNPPMNHQYLRTGENMMMMEEANKICMEISKHMQMHMGMGGMGKGMSGDKGGGGGEAEKPAAENAVEE